MFRYLSAERHYRKRLSRLIISCPRTLSVPRCEQFSESESLSENCEFWGTDHDLRGKTFERIFVSNGAYCLCLCLYSPALSANTETGWQRQAGKKNHTNRKTDNRSWTAPAPEKVCMHSGCGNKKKTILYLTWNIRLAIWFSLKNLHQLPYRYVTRKKGRAVARLIIIFSF